MNVSSKKSGDVSHLKDFHRPTFEEISANFTDEIGTVTVFKINRHTPIFAVSLSYYVQV